MNKLKEWIKSEAFGELMRYAVVGVLTTVVSYGVYWLFMRPFGESPGEGLFMAGQVVSWFVSVAFAYLANRLFVFKSKTGGLSAVAREIGGFFAARLLSLFVFDLGLGLVLLKWLAIDDLLVKLICNIVVIVFNYVVSKLWIFKKP